MHDEQGTAPRRATRRAVVETGAKLAYAAPVVAASFGLTSSGALAAPRRRGRKGGGRRPGGGTGGGATKIALCHATCSDSNPYVLIEIDDNALAAHKQNHHRNCPYTDVVLGPASNGYTKADCPGGAVST